MSNVMTLPFPKLLTRSSTPARWARRALLSRLQKITWGRILLNESGRLSVLGAHDGPEVRIDVHRPSFYTAVALRGDIGAAEAYCVGDWSCEQLTDLVRILTRNFAVLLAVDGGWSWLTRPARHLYHGLRRNTRGGSRRNIAAHYDLGNDFYRLFLDDSMTYSSGVFATPDATLAQASREKYDRICRKLKLTSDDHVIEIGGGWGGFAEHAVEHYGCRVTTTTISRAQFDYMQTRFEDAGLTDRITVLFEDYRDLRGSFDKLVSIEMIEAVGHEYQATFLRQCSDLLKPDGVMALQAITIADQHYKRHVRSVDFIKRYVFPGSSLVSMTQLCAEATRHTDLRLSQLEDITAHYALTLRHWRRRFLDKLTEVKALGFDESFIRMWEYYLGYCEGAFAERYTGTVQLVFTKPLYRLDSKEMEQHASPHR